MKRSLLVFSALLFATAVHMPLMVTAAGKNRLTEDYWQIVSTNGMAVSNLGKFENEAVLYLEKSDVTNPNQAWIFIKVGESEYNIAKPDTFKSIDNDYTGKPDGNPVIQWTTTNGNPNQVWVLEQIGDDSYVIRSKNTGMYLSYIGEDAAGSPVGHVPADISHEKTHWVLRKMEVTFDTEELRTSSKEDWENETVFAINRERGRATFTPYPSIIPQAVVPSGISGLLAS